MVPCPSAPRSWPLGTEGLMSGKVSGSFCRQPPASNALGGAGGEEQEATVGKKEGPGEFVFREMVCCTEW